MKKLLLPFTIFTILLSACSKDDDSLLLLNLLLPNGSEYACDSTKATPYAKRFAAKGYLPGVPLQDGSKILFVAPEALYWHDLNTGGLLRKIESPVAAKAFSYPDAIYQYGDLAVSASTTGLAAFNVKTGQVAWERVLGDCDIDRGVFGVADQYFVVRNVVEPDGVHAQAVFVGTVNDPDRLEKLFMPSYSRATHSWAGYGWITALSAFAGPDGHSYVMIAFFETKVGTNALDNFIGLYDATAQTWVYERQMPAHVPDLASQSGIHDMTVIGATAYLTYGGNILIWDVASGLASDVILAPTPAITAFGGYDPFYRDVWVTDQYLLVETTNGDLQVMDHDSHALLYTVRCAGTLRVEPDLDRFFLSDWGGIYIYQLSTGGRLQMISAPCESFTESLAVWKDSQGTAHLVAAGREGNVYDYLLQ